MTSVAPNPAAGAVAAVRRRNISAVQRESAGMGVVSAAGFFLPVLVIRLGGSNLDVSLLAALPALAGFFLSVPVGAFLQRRRNVIPWYAVTRALWYLTYAEIGVVVFFVPPAFAVTAILVLYTVNTLSATISAVASNAVLNAAGPGGRYDLVSRRYGIAGLTTAISVAVSGQVLDWLHFPVSYVVVFVALALVGVASCLIARQIVIPDHEPMAATAGRATTQRLRGFMDLLRNEPRFIAFVSKRFVLSFGISLAAPLIPLWYIREAHAPDAWIGIIGTAQSLASLTGYYLFRRLARRQTSRTLLWLTTLGSTLFPVALAVSADLVAVAVVAALGAVMAAGLNLVLFDELMKTVPAGRLITFSGVESSLGNLSGMVAPVAGALVATVIGVGPGLLIAGGVTLLGALLLALTAGAPLLSGSPAEGEVGS